MENSSSVSNLFGENAQPKRLTDINISNANEALNLLVSFLNLAQKRGTFAFEESAKIWECIKFFQNDNQS